MKIEIEEINNGFVVRYDESEDQSVYVYRSVDDLLMWEEIAKKFLKRRIKAIEQ